MKLATIAIVLLLFLFVWARWQERTAVFFPTRVIDSDPGNYGLPFEEVTFSSPDGLTLHGWYVPGEKPATVLWLHGNAGNIADRLDILTTMTNRLGVSSFLFDFRGYGKSEGRPTEKGLYRDAEAAFAYLMDTRGISPGNIFLYGHSLGTALTVDLALGTGRDSAGAVLESPFTNAKDMARMIYGGLPVDLLLTLKMDVVGKVGKIDMPVMVIHGESDTIIPISMARRVYEAASEPKRFLPIPGADHSDCYVVGGEAYWQAWKDFIDKAVKGSQKKKP